MKRIVKVNKDNVLNEEFAMSFGYGNGAVVNGFSYNIVPLSTNLSQKGNDPEPDMKNKAYKYFVGDVVKGLCAYDNKIHKGTIKYVHYEEGKTYPTYTYILDFDNNDTLPLIADTVRKCVIPRPNVNPHMDYLMNRLGQIQDTIGGSRAIIESDSINFNIDGIDIETSDKKVDKIQKQDKTPKSLKQIFEDSMFIDLGLPSGTLWCKYNVGVINPNKLNTAKDWYGNYYAWGEVYPKRKYTLFNYEYAYYNENQTEDDLDVLTKYCNNKEFSYDGNIDDLTRLELDDIPDPQIQIDSNLQLNMPTYKLYEELLNCTTKKWIKDYNSIDGLNGILLTSKKYKDLSIFFPACGYKCEELNSCGLSGGYWISDLVIEACTLAWHLSIGKTYANIVEDSRSVGFNVRLVFC